MRIRHIDEDAFRGGVMLVGLILANVIAYRLCGWMGMAGVVSVYCVWRAV
jgi:hypothetical protein